MDTEQRAQRLEAQIAAAFKETEIQEGLHQAGLPEELALERLLSRESEIWDAASSEIADHEEISQELKRVEGEWRSRLPEPPLSLGFLKAASLLAGFATLVGLVLGFLLLAQSIFSFQLIDFAFWWQSFEALLGELTTVSAATEVWPIIFAAVVAIAVVRLAYDKLVERRSNAWTASVKRIADELGLSDLQNREEILNRAIDDALREKGVKPALREIINDFMTPRYDMTLSGVNAQGLSEVFDTAYEISTPARQKLHRMLERMPGGSIGIAGPRGAGKTTLIRSFCRTTEQELKEKPVLPVMMAAPTDYDARDFLLHLFSTVCHEVLRKDGFDGQRLLERQVRQPVASSTGLHVGYGLWRISRYVAAAGVLLMVAAFGVTSFILVEQQAPVQLARESEEVAASTPGLSNETQGSPERAEASLGAGGQDESLQVIKNFIDVMGIKPGAIFMFGAVLALVGFVGNRMRPVQALRREEEAEPDLSDKALSKEALRLLKDMKFQQSHTSGWSGSLKLPIGLGAGVNQASSLARQPLSVPEIVDKYQGFIEQITERYSPIIGIDELDKMSSEDAAHRFLNEIKVVFGQANVFYLVSVSESAISSFERRGLPFRDVFDSSFDDIVYVDYLDVASAKRLLLRRVIGMPVPFLCLCHCLSGGLPEI